MNKKINIVTIGGGSGSFAILSELKKRKKENNNINISAIVAMSDSGGSSGVLMDQYGVLPAGDLRQCLVALAPDGSFLRKLFTHRYDNGFLNGHSFGNIFLSTIENITKSLPKAIIEAEKILNTVGKVFPVTFDNHELIAEMKNEELLISEKNLDNADLRNIKKIYFNKKVFLNKKIPKIVKNADLIIINPGSFFTSILPNLLVCDFVKELKNTKAKKIFITNMLTEKKQTDEFTVLDFQKKLQKYINFSDFDYIFYNTNHKVSKKIKDRYDKEGKFFVKIDEKLSYKKTIFIGSDFTIKPDKDSVNKNFIRYDAKKVLDRVFKIKNIF